MEQQLVLRQKEELRQRFLAQQLRQSEMLGMAALDFEQYVNDEIEENPAIEMSEPESPSDITITADSIGYSPQYKSAPAHSGDYAPQQAGMNPDMQPDLMQQINVLPIDKQQRWLCRYLAGMLDADGYLRRSIADIADDVLFAYNVDAAPMQWDSALHALQGLDPAGIGARNLKECLLLQIERKTIPTPQIACAKQILEKHFDAFAEKKYAAIMKKLNITNQEMDAAIAEIRKLNPKPGTALGGDSTTAAAVVIPDFSVENKCGEIVISLAPMHCPKLNINKRYYDIAQHGGSDAQKFAQHKNNEAAWFVNAIKQRAHTLEIVMNAIVWHQKKFFLTGDEQDLLPLTQSAIAQRTGCDKSTISRAVANKYVQTNYGVFPLNYFFVSQVENADGEMVSVVNLKNAIAQIVDSEDKTNPMSDLKIEQALHERGYDAARRTIAKYREELGIPPSNVRKNAFYE
jgi:RNA polymerase sigma-54 factor